MYTQLVTIYYSVIFCVRLKNLDCKYNMRIISPETQFLILDTYQPYILYLCEQHYRIRVYFSNKILGNTGIEDTRRQVCRYSESRMLFQQAIRVVEQGTPIIDCPFPPLEKTYIL